MKIYLAGPMTGRSNFNFDAFNKTTKKLREAGHTVFNPAEQGGDPTKYREYLAKELAWICAEADAIALLRGWSRSKGATAEHAVAEALGLKTFLL